MYFYYNNDYILTNGDEMENTNKQEHIDETFNQRRRHDGWTYIT